jgi:hypothetical protein
LEHIQLHKLNGFTSAGFLTDFSMVMFALYLQVKGECSSTSQTYFTTEPFWSRIFLAMSSSYWTKHGQYCLRKLQQERPHFTFLQYVVPILRTTTATEIGNFIPPEQGDTCPSYPALKIRGLLPCSRCSSHSPGHGMLLIQNGKWKPVIVAMLWHLSSNQIT